MSQRTIQRSVTEYLDGDDDLYDAPTVQEIKRTTTVDITTKIHLGAGVYHRFQPGGVSGCPNWGDEQEPATIADAIELGFDPCENCNPPDYRPPDITVALPAEQPTEIADLDPIVHTTGNTQRTAHIAARDGDDPTPLCVAVGIYRGPPGTWKCAPQAVYPKPSEWFALGLCGACRAAYDKIDGGQR